MFTISSKEIIPLCLKFFCLFQALGGSLRALVISTEAEGTISTWICLSRIGQFHCNPEMLPIFGCLSDGTANHFYRQVQEANLWGQGRHDTNFHTCAPQVCHFDLLEIQPRWHVGGSRYRMNLDSGQWKTGQSHVKFVLFTELVHGHESGDKTQSVSRIVRWDKMISALDLSFSRLSWCWPLSPPIYPKSPTSGWMLRWNKEWNKEIHQNEIKKKY